MKSYLRLALLIILAFCFARFCVAQSSVGNAQVSGTVSDRDGHHLANVMVQLRNTSNGTTYAARSNDNGFYAIANVAPGTYDLKASRTGFANFTQAGIELSVAQGANLNLKLHAASQGEVIVVTSAMPAIEPTKTEISQVVQTQQIQNLPISNRLFTDFALLTPGVSTSRTSLGTTFTEFETTQISFGGMRTFSNEITVDGADFVNEVSGVQRATPPQGSVQEFRVVNNTFSADYGRTIGGIVNVVTKRGTNDFHGSLYQYLENTAANSRSLLQPAPLPDIWRQNQFGATIGGPIKREKTFFFANYEAHRNAYSPTLAPDLYSNIQNIDLAKSYLGLPPEGKQAGFAGLSSTLRTADNDYGLARLDQQFKSNHHLSLLYNVEDARDLGELVGLTEDGGGIGTPSGGRNLFIRDQSLVGSVDSVLTSSVVNNATAQFARRHYNFPGATGEPDLSVVNDLELGHNFGTYDSIYESRAEVSDSLSWVKHDHIIKFGFDGNYLSDQNSYAAFDPERILFPNLACLYSFADSANAFFKGTYGVLPTSGCPLPPQADGVEFLYEGVSEPRSNCPDVNVACTGGFYNGYVSPAATGAGYGGGWPNAIPNTSSNDFNFRLDHGYWGAFAEDQWRVTPSIALNYGLRWDVETGLGYAIDSYYKGFQPRVGLAWSPGTKTVIRTGYGLYFDRNNMTFFFTTGNEKTIPGYFCGNGATPASCTTAGLSGVTVPMISARAASGGIQIQGVPGFPGTPALSCPPLPASFCVGQPGGTLGFAALDSLETLAGLPYSSETLNGPCTLSPAGPAGACGVGAGGIEKSGGLPYASQASVQVDREIAHGLTLSAAYLYVHANDLVRGNNINVPCPLGTSKPNNPYYAQGWLNPNGSLTPCDGTPALGPFGLGPIFGTLNNPSGLEFGVPSQGNPAPTLSAGLLDYNNNVAYADYNGLTFSAVERMGKIFILTANYTYSHTIDDGNFTTFINLPPNQFDYAAEKANSNQDLRHRLVANFIANAPHDGWYKNFTLGSIVTLQSGSPFTLFTGADVLGDLAGLSTDRVGGAPIQSNCTSVQNCETMVPRNTYVGDPLYTWDFHIGRFFQVRENLHLNLGIDAFNLLNRQNVQEVQSVYGSPVFCGSSPLIPEHYNDSVTREIQAGQVSCATQQTIAQQSPVTTANPSPVGLAWINAGALPVTVPNAPNAAFGTPRTVLNPRQLQFSLRLAF